jgi:hypothetical protein
MSRIPLKYPEGDERILRVYAVVKNNDNTESPYDLTSHVITLIRKQTKDVSDTDPGNITSACTIVNAAGGIVDCPLTAPMLTPTGTYWYKIVGVAASKRITLQYGPLDAVNT